MLKQSGQILHILWLHRSSRFLTFLSGIFRNKSDDRFIHLIIFHSIEMSVLEQDECGVSELLKCKLNYLEAENSWMHREYDYLCKLIELQKQIIHSESEDLAPLHQDIAAVLNERSSFLQEAKKKSEISNREMEIQEFVPMIYSFEEKIERLQREIKNRQSSLQSIQLSKGSEFSEKKLEIKCINSYDSNSRILDRIRKEIAALKLKKTRLENDLLALNERKDDESTVNSANVQSLSKVIDEHTITHANEDQTSVFEKVIMLVKKKRYQNSCLQDKVNRYRNSIGQKKAASAQLKKEIEGLEWNCLEGFVGACGFVESDEVGDLSLVGKSFTNNTSFSFDVSRFIKPARRFRAPQI